MRIALLSVAVLVVMIGLIVTIGGCFWSREPGGTSSSTPYSEDENQSPMAGVPVQPAVPPVTITPKVGPFINSGNLAGANLEAGNISTAAQAYSTDNQGIVYFTSDDLVPLYVSSQARARYYFSSASGIITRVDSVPGGWVNIVFSLSQQKWINGVPDNNHPNDQDIS